MSIEYIENARISKTFLGKETKEGSLTAYITIELSIDGVQTFGGMNLSLGDDLHKFIDEVLRVCEVNTWEDLPGQHVRVRHRAGVLDTIIGIGHITKDKWYLPDELAEDKSKW